MPELPEVETMVRGIRKGVEGRRLEDVVGCPTHCKPIRITPNLRSIQRRLRGRSIEAVERLAKRVVLRFDNGDRFVVEPRMTGLMLLSDPPDEEHLRLRFDLDGGMGPAAFWFWDRRGLGTATLYKSEEFAERLGTRVLGPDALAMTFDEWWVRCRSTTRAIKVAMLDQRFVAGIGNLYASEILHRSSVRPTRRANRLSKATVERIRTATVDILTDAIRYEGSTLSDGTYRNALNQDGGYQNHHRVYARAGEPCPTCTGGVVRRIVQAQRSTFFCPACQR